MMSPEEFTHALQEWRAMYGSAVKERTAKSDQSLAALYVRSGLTQRAIAEIEGITHKAVDFRLRFGRFLALGTTGTQGNLTERSFRGYWARTDKTATEDVRFDAIMAMIEADRDKPPTPRGKNIMVKRLLAEFGDGEFHAVRVMATKLDVPQEKLLTTLEGMRLHGFYHTEGERRRAPATDGGWRYRLRPHRGHVVPYDTLREELKPLLDELRYQGQQDQYKIAPIVFTNMAHKIEQALDKLAR